MSQMIFAEEKEKKQLSSETWKVLVVDDEEEVHHITRAVISKFDFDNKGIELFSAYSGEEAIEKLKEIDDIALILLDVVMETDHAGLDAVKRIRGELNNSLVRIILRTGQPGSAPEQEVIRDYDINDYKEKTELTSSKLYTSVIASLRAYRDISLIEQNRLGLKKIIESSSTIFQLQSFKNFAQAVLVQLLSLIELQTGNSKKDSFSIVKNKDGYELLAATGSFENRSIDDILSEHMSRLLDEAMLKKEHINKEEEHLYFFETNNGTSSLFYFVGNEVLSEANRALIDIFSTNVSIAFENLNIKKEISDTQKELISRLSGVIEIRANESSGHINHVAEISYVLAKAVGLEERICKLIKSASPMHDIGKMEISEDILRKAGKLNEEEFRCIQTHASLGAQILDGSPNELLQMACIIAKEHHERWDGLGYPDGKAGEDIHIYGRITMIADIFDALLHKRSYKEAWPMEDALKFIEQESGRMLDPHLVELFFDNLDEIKHVCERG